jgi:hypothetical protein
LHAAPAVNGQPCPRAEAVLPMREISYSWLNNADEVLQSGQLVRVAVVQVSQAPEAKVLVSLKRLEEDPLKETLDNVLPLDREVGGGGGAGFACMCVCVCVCVCVLCYKQRGERGE